MFLRWIDGDGRLTGNDATKFFAMSNLSRPELKQVTIVLIIFLCGNYNYVEICTVEHQANTMNFGKNCVCTISNKYEIWFPFNRLQNLLQNFVVLFLFRLQNFCVFSYIGNLLLLLLEEAFSVWLHNANLFVKNMWGGFLSAFLNIVF